MNINASSGPPESVYVSGLPLFQRGWNGWYESDPDTKKRWNQVRLNYLGLSLRPTAIVRNENTDRWMIVDLGSDSSSKVICESQDHKDAPTPIGLWKDCVLVAAERSLETWWTSNRFIVRTLCLLAVAALLFGCRWTGLLILAVGGIFLHFGQ